MLGTDRGPTTGGADRRIVGPMTSMTTLPIRTSPAPAGADHTVWAAAAADAVKRYGSGDAAVAALEKAGVRK